MKDVFGIPQSVLIVGGNSEIAMAILEKLMGLNRLERVILLTQDGVWIHKSRFTSIDKTGRVEFSIFAMSDFILNEVFEGKAIDVCVIATGYLPKDDQIRSENVEKSINANSLVPIQYTDSIATHMERQGHGLIIGLSSIAAVRIRPSNWVYGMTKSLFDMYLQNLILKLENSGVRILIVRPGMVRTRMSKHLKEVPFAINAEEVADQVVKNLLHPSGVLWVPPILRIFALFLRVLPRFVLKILERQ